MDLAVEIAGLRGDMREVIAEIRGEVNTRHAELTTQLTVLANTMNQLASEQSETRQLANSNRTDINSVADKFRAHVDMGVGASQARMGLRENIGWLIAALVGILAIAGQLAR